MDKYEQLKRAWADHKRQEAAFAAGCGIMPGMPDMPSAGLASDFGDLVIENIDALLADADENAALKDEISAIHTGQMGGYNVYQLANLLHHASKMDADKEAEIAALRAELDAFKADIEAGRLVRYPDFPQDMNDILEPLKVQSALNSEVMKLNFRKEHRPKDVSILDYTVIAALNKVLEEAAKTALEGE